jgi:flagellar biogenesis protein FliO
MDILTPDRLIPLAGFMAVLILIWAVVRLNRPTLAARVRAGRKIEATETLLLGHDARATLLKIEGQQVLVITSRRGPASMMTLPPAAPAAPQVNA